MEWQYSVIEKVFHKNGKKPKAHEAVSRPERDLPEC